MRGLLSILLPSLQVKQKHPQTAVIVADSLQTLHIFLWCIFILQCVEHNLNKPPLVMQYFIHNTCNKIALWGILLMISRSLRFFLNACRG